MDETEAVASWPVHGIDEEATLAWTPGATADEDEDDETEEPPPAA